MNKISLRQLFIAIFFTIGLFFHPFLQTLTAQTYKNSPVYNEHKIVSVIDYIRRYYVENTALDKISEKGIVEMLKELDPHSIYISTEEIAKMNEPLIGNFDGIGVAFQILRDTISIVEVIPGGPSEKVGVFAGDQILKVNDTAATGDSIKNDWVFKHLRGKKGSIVKITIKRKGNPNAIDFKIRRDKIPIQSINAWHMIDDRIGYLKLDRFAQTSMKEFYSAMQDLKSRGMESLILDLRGNGGGFLDVAFYLCDEFLSGNKLIVYTEGISSPRMNYNSGKRGSFEDGRLVVLIDEGSASASEILSGAIQDWDRGFVVGRRSFGKGLVQRPFELPDGSQMRLTTSRYYTPSGRCIQKPYNDGVESYYNDYMKRYQHKELITPDSISFPDSLKYKTHGGRIVYGGGGIMPDIFVPIDTSQASDYLINLRSKGVFNDFSLEWTNEHRKKLLKKYPTYEEFIKNYSQFNLLNDFESYAEKNNIKKASIRKEWVNNMVIDYLKEKMKDSTQTDFHNYEDYADFLFNKKHFENYVLEKAKKADKESNSMIEKSDKYIEYTLKAMVARSLYGTRYYFQTMQDMDEGLQKAIDIIRNDKLFKTDNQPDFQALKNIRK